MAGRNVTKLALSTLAVPTSPYATRSDGDARLPCLVVGSTTVDASRVHHPRHIAVDALPLVVLREDPAEAARQARRNGEHDDRAAAQSRQQRHREEQGN